MVYMKSDISSIDELPSFWIYRVHIQGAVSLRKAFLAAGFDLTPEQWGVMTRLRDNEGMNQNQLAERTFKDRHNINRILNLLEKHGYIKRCPDKSDKRAHSIFLTKSGRMIQEKLTPIVLNNIQQRFNDLSPEDLSALRRILEHVTKNIERIGENVKDGLKPLKVLKDAY